MKQHRAQLLVPSQCQVGESLIWHPQHAAVYWVDITGKQLHRFVLSSEQHTVWDTPEMTGCIALCADGSFIAGMESGLFQIEFNRHTPLRFTKLCDAPHSAPHMRFNDGRTDRQGRFIAGTMTIAQTVGQGNPSVYQYAKPYLNACSNTGSNTDLNNDLNNDLSTRLSQAQKAQLKTLLTGFVSPFTTPNGTAFSPDGRTFYLSDSHASQQRVWAFDYDTQTGTPSHRREFIDMNQHPGRPDGAAMDTDGCYWICATDAGLIHRFTPQGTLDYSLTVPVKKPTICTFGGSTLRTLFVASVRPAGDVSDQPLAGGVFVFEGLGVQGIAETPFAQ